jgi:adenosine deaminase
VVLHDHLDGGLRPATIAELAADQGYRGLPAGGEETIAAWFRPSGAGSLQSYLDRFVHTIALTQTADSLERVAFEAGVDLWDDGVRYAEVRFAPTVHTREELRRDDVIEAVLAGMTRAASTTGIVMNGIAVAMRNGSDSEQVARTAVRWVGEGLVAFDLAGPEMGYPANAHVEACRIARGGGLGLTIHAGEAYGPESIAQAVLQCGASRVGHGVKIADDLWMDDAVIEVSSGGAAAGSTFRFDEVDGEDVKFGDVARIVRDHRILLEVCPKSNADTGATAAKGEHPLGLLLRLGFNISLNPDNRLMSDTTMTDEFENAMVNHGFGIRQLLAVTESALHGAFGDWSDRRRLLTEVVRPAYGVS